MEFFIIFAPIFLTFLIGIFIPIQIMRVSNNLDNKKILVVMFFWVVLSLLMLLFTINYLIGPSCVFCYEPTKVQKIITHFCGALIYGLFGLALILIIKRAAR